MVVNAIDGIVIVVACVRGAIFTCFFGSTAAYVVFFMAFDLRDMGDTLAVFRSIFFVLVATGLIGGGGRALELQLLLLLLVLLWFCAASNESNFSIDDDVGANGGSGFVSSCCPFDGSSVKRITMFATAA